MNESPQYRESMAGVVRLGADLLGAVCLLNTLVEALSQGGWHSYTDIYQIYYYVLSAYAALRQTQKWTSREPAVERKTGEFFVLAWIILAVFLWAYGSLISPVLWPPAMDKTLSVVISVFALSKGVQGLRGLPLFGGGHAGPAGSGEPKPTGGGESLDSEILIKAYQELGTFTVADVMNKTGLGGHVVAGHVGQMLRQGLIKKLPDGRFQWVG